VANRKAADVRPGPVLFCAASDFPAFGRFLPDTTFSLLLSVTWVPTATERSPLIIGEARVQNRKKRLARAWLSREVFQSVFQSKLKKKVNDNNQSHKRPIQITPANAQRRLF
jgi:hypothetical protein